MYIFHSFYPTGRVPECLQHWELCLLFFFSKVVNISSIHKGPPTPEHLAVCPHSYDLLYQEICMIQLAGIRQLPLTDFPLGNTVRWFWSHKKCTRSNLSSTYSKRSQKYKAKGVLTVSREFRSRNPTKTSKRFVLNSLGCFCNSHPQSLSWKDYKHTPAVGMCCSVQQSCRRELRLNCVWTVSLKSLPASKDWLKPLLPPPCSFPNWPRHKGVFLDTLKEDRPKEGFHQLLHTHKCKWNYFTLCS